jgi:hypothetical protein
VREVEEELASRVAREGLPQAQALVEELVQQLALREQSELVPEEVVVPAPGALTGGWVVLAAPAQ